MRINEDQTNKSGGFRIAHFETGLCVRLLSKNNDRTRYYLTVDNAEAINLLTGMRRDITPDDRFVEVEAEIVIHS